jgi:hypothetical protein
MPVLVKYRLEVHAEQLLPLPRKGEKFAQVLGFAKTST